MAIGNRVTEKDLRDWLANEGFSGRSAKIEELELHAIQRPGWLQVFRFSIQVKVSAADEDHPAGDSGWLQRFGVIVDDERRKRNKTQIWMFEDEFERQTLLDEVSEDLLVLRRGQTATGLGTLAMVFLGIVFLVLLLTLLFPTA